MKKFRLLFMFLLILGCNSKTEDEKIFQEYLLLNYNYWKTVSNLEHYSLHNFYVGDTITLQPGISLLNFPDDTTQEVSLDRENFLHIEQPTDIVLTWSNDQLYYMTLYHFQTINLDSTINGMISSDDLIKNLNGLSTLIADKNSRLKRIRGRIENYNISVARLADKYEITEDSLYNLLAKEYFKSTGNQIFSY